MIEPLVSVIIPCYNAEKFVEKSVRSIMEQTYKNLEIIVINDCSNDSTKKILLELQKEDSRIVYIENEFNLKLPKTLNKGISISNGKYIARMDADDISFYNRIEKQMDFLLKNSCIDMISANYKVIDDLDNITAISSSLPTEHRDIINRLTWQSPFAHPLVIGKRSFFINLGGYRDIHYAEDYDMWIRGWLEGYRFANLNEILLYYRHHDNQMTDKKYNAANSHCIRSFLWQYFIKEKNMRLFLGYIMHFKLPFIFVKKLIHFRRKLMFLYKSCV
ncbi:glycosyltransferase [Glaesserella parasuis]|uniref:Putative glycosyltransferase n=1 Tax=Glaesserella parasuis TaxID=738 RepID=T1RQ38_GLAPU|nr:glycosyltransferase [Glaesserella parasuis]AGM38712.1 putative glycosyltransferase [Glaesserella parasuis]KEZ22584.1 Chondroitin polymerase [Glaesserella parasuis]MDG6230053.1 glycosyltransferase [Glaesserella parasuis]MDG6470533.1 glycosyltransferase [Glaesserella parasuis]MDO9766323.1 glycosyltransferase [Glaesserella parasuis]